MDSGRLHRIIKEVLEEQKKKRDRCLRIADRKYDKPSAYKSGAVVRCRKGDIWKDLNEIGDASAKSYPFTSDIDPSKLVDIAKEYHKTHTSHTYYETKLTYRFKTDKANYVVTFAVSMERKRYINFTGAPNFKPGPPYDTYAEVGFNIDGDTEERNTDLNEQFSVLSTVTKIIFDFIDKLNASGGNLMILYIGAKNDTDSSTKLDSKRGKLYAAYLKKNLSKLPGYDAREHTNSDGNEFIQIYKKGSVDKVENLQEDESLHKWFSRKGAKGSTSGWVDCNAPDGKGGYKSCGRQEGEKRSKYPACRPTPSACKTKGKGKTWGKKAKK